MYVSIHPEDDSVCASRRAPSWLALSLLSCVAAAPVQAQVECPDLAFMRSQESRFIGLTLTDVVFEDLDGDGRADVVGLTGGAGGPLLAVGRNLGLDADGILQWGSFQLLTIDGGTKRILGGDFDGDGHADVVLSVPSLNRLVTLRGDGEGGFGAGIVTACAQSPSAVAAGDMNGDGRTDIVSAWGPGAFAVLKWDGVRLAAGVGIGIGPLAPINRIVLVDENADGTLDVFSNYSSIGLAANVGAGTAGDGQVLFQPPINVSPQIYPAFNLSNLLDFTLADVTGDGVPDLVGLGFLSNASPPPYASGVGYLYAQAAAVSGVWQGAFGTTWANYAGTLSHVAGGRLEPGAPLRAFFTNGVAIYDWFATSATDIYRPTPSPPGPPSFADVDGDGRVDLVARSEDGGGILVAIRGCAPHPELPASPRPAGDWQAGGVELNSGGGRSTAPSACSDGAGGLFVTWVQDDGTGATNVWLQHLSPSGVPFAGWPAAGLPLAPSGAVPRSAPRALSDGTGGAFVAWAEPAGAIRLQRVLANGTRPPAWPEAGLPVPPDGASDPTCSAATWGAADDDSGGVLVLGYSAYGNGRVWADRIGPDAVRTAGWPAQARTVSSGYSDAEGYAQVQEMSFVTDLGSSICAYVSVRRGCNPSTHGCLPPYVYTSAQLIAVAANGDSYLDYNVGNPGDLRALWPDRRGAALGWLGSKTISRLTFGGPGAWTQLATLEPTLGSDVSVDPDLSVRVVAIEADDAAPVGAPRLYLNKLEPGGLHSAGWPADGRRLTWSPVGGQASCRILEATDGSLLVFDIDGRSGSPAMYVMRLDREGHALPGWDFGGQPVVEDVGAISISDVVNGFGGAAYVVWSDSRDGAPSVRAQRIGTDLVVPVAFAALEPRASAREVELDWYVSSSAAEEFAVERAEVSEWREIARALADGSGHVRVTDRDVKPGHMYAYRLRSSAGTSPTVWVTIPQPPALALRVLNAPRADGALRVAVELAAGGPAKLEWFDVLGRRLGAREMVLEAGLPAEVVLDEGAMIPQGVLLLRLSGGGASTRTRTVVLR